MGLDVSDFFRHVEEIMNGEKINCPCLNQDKEMLCVFQGDGGI